MNYSLQNDLNLVSSIDFSEVVKSTISEIEKRWQSDCKVV